MSIHPVYLVFWDRRRDAVVARNIRRLWPERRLKQDELAARIRITRNYVGMIERQENSPTVAVLERIAKALGIEPARLFDEKAAGRKGE
jgi:transcriptional regulator with XRE-family HTH domain